MKIIPASDSSLLIDFGEAIRPDTNRHVVALFRALSAKKDSRFRNLHPAYASLLIDFDPLQCGHAELAKHVTHLMEGVQAEIEVPARIVTIPVCYDEEFGPDLADIASHNGISLNDVVRLHTSAAYRVYFLGFSPGFAYLGGLPRELATPRLATPRSRVPAGSVGIAGEQTAVYPIQSAGGWRLIGRTPMAMFDIQSDPPTTLQTGDQVRFEAIPRGEFDRIKGGC